MAFDGTILTPGSATIAPNTVSAPPGQTQPARRSQVKAALALSVDRLPFVGQRGDGQKSYWRMPALSDNESAKLRARTYAAWYLLYAEVNGADAGRQLLDKIEREMPSRYPNVDRIFLDEVLARR